MGQVMKPEIYTQFVWGTGTWKLQEGEDNIKMDFKENNKCIGIGISQSVSRRAGGPGFDSRRDRLWGPLSLLSNGYRG
jgi:hypothetical protein